MKTRKAEKAPKNVTVAPSVSTATQTETNVLSLDSTADSSADDDDDSASVNNNLPVTESVSVTELEVGDRVELTVPEILSIVRHESGRPYVNGRRAERNETFGVYEFNGTFFYVPDNHPFAVNFPHFTELSLEVTEMESRDSDEEPRRTFRVHRVVSINVENERLALLAQRDIIARTKTMSLTPELALGVLRIRL